MARPKKPDQKRRENTFQIRLQTDERKVINDAAKALSLDSSAWARMILLQQAKKGIEGKSIGYKDRNE